jgi:hypothetical protein
LNEPARPVCIAFRRALEEAIEPAEKSLQYSLALDLWPKQERCKRRTQGKGVEGRQKHGDRDRHGELLVEPSGNSLQPKSS